MVSMCFDEIRCIPCPNCKVCGSPGLTIYQGLQDRLFSAPGLWNLKRCNNNKCGLIWLDPMPLEEDIHKAYQSYYTHGETSIGNWRDNNYFITKVLTFMFRLFLRLTPIHRERIESEQMYLGNIKPGNLLEIGCGDGTRLLKLAALGWSVEGQEVDPVSANIASRTGIRIHLGSIEELGLPDSSYDAIVMNHVIEHVHEPVRLLNECRRLLKKDGILVSVTPNTNSWGHKIFKSNWRGLEPPRHIMLHCPSSLHHIAHNAGFRNSIIYTASPTANGFAYGSLQIAYGGRNCKQLINIIHYIISVMFLFFERFSQIFLKYSGEECILLLRK